MKTINNNIEEQTVGFDNAKLLKEKGFDVVTKGLFFDGELNSTVEAKNSDFESSRYFSAPTQQVAIDWIWINFGIHIEIQHDGTFSHFTYKLCKLNKNNIKTEPHYLHPFGEGFHTPEEAKEATINYVLTKLI